MKIVFLCNEYPPCTHGGIGTFTRLAARFLVQAGHSVRVLGYGTDGLPERSVDDGVEVFRMPQVGFDGMGIRARLSLYSLVKQWCREWNANLVEVPDAEGWAAGWFKLPIPVVSRAHGSVTYFAAEMKSPRTTARRIAYHFERASLRRSDAWCSVSRYTAVRTQHLFDLQECGGVHYNPIDHVDLPATPRSRNVVLYTGTLTEKKGIFSLASAWPEVIRAFPTAELHIAGKGETARRKLVERLDSATLASIRFHGEVRRDTVLQMLKAARVAVFPSYAEAFALAPMEAMAAGCPTIYSLRSSGPELITHEENGLLVDPDRPSEIAGAIVKVLKDDALAARLSDAGRSHVRASFSPESWTRATESFYRACIDSFRTRQGWRSKGIDTSYRS
jgi:glycosyltransferase involved in cell wall biosynthesis